jgi:hypothetical protein
VFAAAQAFCDCARIQIPVAHNESLLLLIGG